MDELINRTLGGYQIIEQIGIGGMATVYKAYQASMDRYVAVKVLPRQLAEDPNFLARFEQEARTIARLENKNILPVYDYGTQEGYTYLVMRYVGQGTLKDLTSQGPLPLPTAVDFLEQIAEALQYAHDKGVIHRDVKTSNVLIDEHQQCYLTDFGIAKLAASSAHFTASGALIGTPSYMSPEQCSGMAIDHRSDLYSLGIVLYEMLTGAVPYQAETPVAIVLMHMQSPLPSPRQVNPNIPESVEKVVFRALAKSPEERYQSARDFAQALRRALEEATDSATLSLPTPQTTRTASAGVRVSTRAATPTQLPTPTAPASSGVRTYTLRLTKKRVFLAALLLLGGLLVLGALSKRRESPLATTPNTATASQPTETALPEETAAPPTAAAVAQHPTQLPTPSATATLPPTASPTLPPTEATEVAALPPTSDIGGAGTLPEGDFTLDIFTTTRGYEDTHRQVVLTRGGVWVSSGGGLEFWSRDGETRTYTSANGLLFNSIQTLAVDRRGALWLLGGETPGIMRLPLTAEGEIEEIQVFTTQNSALRSDFAWALYADRDEVLVGTYETLIEAWDAERGWHEPSFPTVGSALEEVGDRVWTLVRTHDDTLWVGGPAGAARLSPGATEWKPLEPPPQVRDWDYEWLAYTHFYPDRADDSLWVFGYAEPNWRPFAARLVYNADEPDPWLWEEWPASLPQDVRDIVRAPDGTLWVVLYDKVIRYTTDGARKVFSRDDGLPGEVFLHIAADRDSTVWLTSDIGIASYDGERWKAYLSDFAVPFHEAVAMAEQSDGTLWFASPYGDLMAFYERTWWEVVESFEVQISDLVVVDDVLWVATDRGLVRWKDGIARRYTTANGLSDNRVFTLAVDPQNPTWLWVGTADGLNVLDVATDEVRSWTFRNGDLPAPSVTLLYQDWRGRLWMATGDTPNAEGGYRPTLFLRKRPQDENAEDAFTWVTFAQPDAPFGKEDTAILSLGVDQEGTLWVGTDAMLYRYDGAWTTYTEEIDPKAPMYTPVTALYAEGAWVLAGTAHEGLFFYDGARWHALGMGGIGSPTVHRIGRSADGALWILSADSIARLQGALSAFVEE